VVTAPEEDFGVTAYTTDLYWNEEVK